jgi:hypothetical protein
MDTNLAANSLTCSVFTITTFIAIASGAALPAFTTFWSIRGYGERPFAGDVDNA